MVVLLIQVGQIVGFMGDQAKEPSPLSEKMWYTILDQIHNFVH